MFIFLAEAAAACTELTVLTVEDLSDLEIFIDHCYYQHDYMDSNADAKILSQTETGWTARIQRVDVVVVTLVQMTP